ncbi:MAG: SDR family oxidoreductase [Pseudomonadota bacterium]
MTKTVLITGGSRGIGEATAELAAAAGWRVVITYRAEVDRARAVVERLQAKGAEISAYHADVADAASVSMLFSQIAEEVGPLHAVVANAGQIAKRMKLVDMAPERMDQLLRVNVLGALLTAQGAAKAMGKSFGGTGGALVLISSAAARLGSGNEFVDYAASKGAIDTLVTGLATELGPDGIRVNGIRPGLIETEMQAASGWPERATALAANVPLGRSGTAEEVAEGIVWLLSDAARYVNGANIDITGGR